MTAFGKLVIGVIVIILAIGAWIFFGKYDAGAPASSQAASYESATYTIEGQPVALVNGQAQEPAAPGSASMTTTKYFGNEATGDLNGDGVPDAAFILTQDSGGSGTFYYVVAALASSSGYVGTNAVLLGDRIAPQSTQIENGELIVNYADRKPGDPMTTQPSVGVSKYLQVQNGMLVEAAPVPDQTYTDSKLSFSIMYPSIATSSSVDYSGYLPLTQTPLASFVLPTSMFADTNLSEAGVYVGASSSPEAITSCSEGTPISGESAQGTVTINGANFFVFTSSDAGAGNFYDSKIYRRIENGWCVEVVELLHSTDIGNYTPGTVTAFDKTYFQQILESIVETYRSIPTGI